MRFTILGVTLLLLAATYAAAGDAKPDSDVLEVHGRVMGPDGKPKPGAALSLKQPVDGSEPEPLTTADADGRFRFSVVKTSIRGDSRVESPWQIATVVASAQKCGPDWI